MVLFRSARLFILRKSSPLHVYSILHVYWYWYVQNFTLLMIQNKVFHSITKAIPKQSQIILKYSKVSQSIPKHPKVSQSSNGKKLPTQNSPLHGLILVCTFIDFEKILPPARLFCPACLMFFKNFSTCTFILACTSIRYTRVCCSCLIQRNR